VATSQFIAPATIGDQLSIGGPVVSTGLGQVLQPSGVLYTGYGARKYTYVLFTTVPSYDLLLTQTFCRRGAVILALSGSELFRPINPTSLTDYGSPIVWNYSSYLSPLGVESFRYLRPSVADKSVALDLLDQICRASGPQLLDLNGNRTLRAISFRGYAQDSCGTPAFIIDQFVILMGEDLSKISRPKYISSSFTYLGLLRQVCQQGFMRINLSILDLSVRLVPFLGEEQTRYGSAALVQTPRWLQINGDTHDWLGTSPFVSNLQIWLYLSETLCVQGTALQHYLGESRGLHFVGVAGEAYGSVTFVQGPPRILFTGQDFVGYGTLTIAVPLPQTLTLTGLDTNQFGLVDVFLQDQFIYLSGLGTLQFGGQALSIREPPRPDGLDATEFGTAFVSHFIRRLYPSGADWLSIGSSDLQLSKRFLSPVWDAMDSISSPVVWVAVWGGHEASQFGAAYLQHLLTSIGPFPGQDSFETVTTHKFEHGLRFVDGFDAVPNLPIPDPLVWNHRQYLYMYSATEFSKVGEYTSVANLNVPIFPVGESLSYIPYTHTLGFNHNQKFFQGVAATKYGAITVDYRNRRLYPIWTPFPNVFNPNMRVTKTPVVFPPSVKQDAYGYPHVRILTQWISTTGQNLDEIGSAFAGDAVRSLPVQGLASFESIDVFQKVYLAQQFVVPVGLDHFVQPWSTTYLEERFTEIEPFHLGKADYGNAAIKNLNRELGFYGWGLSAYGSSEITLFTRYIEPAGVSGKIGNIWAGDPTQILYGLKGGVFSEYGSPSIYWGQPWLPYTQVVTITKGASPGPIGTVRVSRNPQLIERPGFPLNQATKYGTASAQGLSAGFGFQLPSEEFGIFAVLAAVPRSVVFGGTLFTGYGKPRMSPSYIYARPDYPSPPNPYEGTRPWYPPDRPLYETLGYPMDRDPGPGSPVVSNYIRQVRPVGRTFSVLDVYFGVSSKTLDLGFVRLYPTTNRLPKYGVPDLLGGVRTVSVWAGVDTFESGSASLQIPAASVPLPPAVPQGTDQTQFGATLAQLFIRNIYPISVDGAIVPGFSSTDPNDLFTSLTVSRSPRYVEQSGISTSFLPDHRVSFFIRDIFPVGDVYTRSTGFSPNAFRERLEVIQGSPSLAYPTYTLGVSSLVVGEPVISGGCC